MALGALDRLLTIAVTATITSAAWIVAGSTVLERAGTLASGGIGSGTMGAGATGANWAGRETAANDRSGRQDSAAPKAAIRPVYSPDGRLVLPVAGVRPAELVDTFTAARAGGARVHDAIDIMAREGTPVVAAAPGRVEKLFVSKAGGNTVYVRSDDGRTIFYYAHLRDYAPGLSEGKRIARGQSLGTVGYTGNASPSGPHLHFAIMQTTPRAKWWEPATALNPYPLLAGK